MAPPTTNLRIEGVRPLLSPAILMEELPLSADGERTVDAARRGVKNILLGMKEGQKKVADALENFGTNINHWRVGSPFGDEAFFHGDWLLRATAARLTG